MSANHEYLDGNLVFSRVKTFCQDRLLVKETHSSAVRVAADRSYDLKFEKTAPHGLRSFVFTARWRSIAENNAQCLRDDADAQAEPQGARQMMADDGVIDRPLITQFRFDSSASNIPLYQTEFGL